MEIGEGAAALGGVDDLAMRVGEGVVDAGDGVFGDLHEVSGCSGSGIVTLFSGMCKMEIQRHLSWHNAYPRRAYQKRHHINFRRTIRC